ncbi:MAG: hypothetical protein KDC80_25470, partial [Saprospiraceae bacterium]|nr:hypothetical protein [Saprospiraceae bacterium]
MIIKNISIFSITLLLLAFVHGNPKSDELDVISYDLTIEPNIDKNYIRGTVVIKFQIEHDIDSVEFKSGNLRVDKVTGDNVVSYKNGDGSLIIKLSKRENKENEITIYYQGNPANGLLFDSDRGQAFTIFSTSRWMICNDSPGDKAYFQLKISIPADKDCVASGELVSQLRKNDKIEYSYQQNYESPTYTYGFAIGNFNQAQENSGDVLLRYYSQ